MEKLLGSQTDRAYAALRIVAGVAFGFHGVQKVFTVYMKEPIPIGSQAWIGGWIELLCGALLAFGFLTSWAAFLASGTMAVAYIQFHWKFRFDAGFFPAVNQGELALLYCFLFLYMACKGSGPWSLDALRKPRPPAA